MRSVSRIFLSLAAVLPLLVASCSHSDPRTQALIDLRAAVKTELATLTPGDWVIIGTSPTIESAAKVGNIRYLSAAATNVSTLRETLDLMEQDEKLSPRLWVCRELEQDSEFTRTPGTARLRTHLRELLIGRTHFSVDERVIAMQIKMLEPQRRLLFIHTETNLPHSCIGIELDYAGQNKPIIPSHSTHPQYQHADLKP